MADHITDEAVTAGSGSVYEHRLNYDDYDGEGRIACICGQWREPGLMDGDEYDWGHHVARAVLAAALPVLNTTTGTEAALEAVRAVHRHHYLDQDYATVDAANASYAGCRSCGWLPNGVMECPTLAAASLRVEQ